MYRILARCVFLAIAIYLAGCAPRAEDEPAATGPLTADATLRHDRVLRLVLRLTGDGVETVEAVAAPGRVGRRDPNRSSPSFFRAVDRDGRVLFERGLKIETHLRSETAGPDGAIEGRRVPIDEPVFTVLVPLFEELDRVRFYRAEPGASRHDAVPIGEVRP